MCLLTFYPEGKGVDEKALRNGAFYNNDGHGYAIVDEDRILIGHSLSFHEIIAEFLETRKRYPSGPALFHSRMSTHGSTDIGNCHPFYVGGDKRTVVAHNGIMPQSCQPTPGDHRSDTRILAEDLLDQSHRIGPSSFFNWRTNKGRRRISGWMGQHNKLVILTVDPKMSKQAFILNEKAGIWNNGIWYSNTGFQIYTTSTAGWSYPTLSTRYDEFCPVCLATDRIGKLSRTCYHCMICIDCMSEVGECLCYMPARLDGDASDRTSTSIRVNIDKIIEEFDREFTN